ncbi:UNVERIFIED_CONTAM: hypothetical protein RMT77_003588 [Armadillidium vulgare]
MKEQLKLLPLHKHPEFKDACVEMLNKEWPRNVTLRCRFLDSSCDDLPTCLILLLTDENGSDILVGHSKLTVIYNEENSVFIESVIIHHDYRGRGFGKVLMSKTEEYAANLGFKTIVLNTKLKGFYSKLGYKFSEPVCLIRHNASKALAHTFKYKFNSSEYNKNCTLNFNNCNSLHFDNSKTPLALKLSSTNDSSTPPSLPPPPPPPPPPSRPVTFRNRSVLNESKDLYPLEENVHIFMRKTITY